MEKSSIDTKILELNQYKYKKVEQHHVRKSIFIVTLTWRILLKEMRRTGKDGVKVLE